MALPGIVDDVPESFAAAGSAADGGAATGDGAGAGRLNSVEVDLEFATPEEAQQFLREELEKSNLPPPAPTELMQAEDLVDQAAAARGRKRLKLLAAALEICPDCADAHLRWRIASAIWQKIRPLLSERWRRGRR